MLNLNRIILTNFVGMIDMSKKKKREYEYDSNNSGGGWWLTDDNWKALEKAGWKVDWRKDEEGNPTRFLGALATSATKEFLNKQDAIKDFEKVTGAVYDDEGCECCGPPHYIRVKD